MNREELVAALKKASDSHWASKGEPILLSNLPPVLLGDAHDYKEALEDKSLKQFIVETAPEGGYKLLEHPTQRAKLGIIPAQAEFKFPERANVQQPPEKIDERLSERALVEFLRALKRLPANDLAEVRIPVTVLVKLVK